MNLAAQVHDLMGREAQEIAALQELLEREYECARSRDGAALEAVTAAKRESIERLESCAREKGRLLAAHGLPGGASGFEQLLGRLGPQRQEAEARWATLKEQLQACHKRNQVNGLLLDASLRATHNALAVLLGHGRESDTYNSQGSLNANRGARTYAKA